MQRLETFGGLRLTSEVGPIAMTQRRRLALLALLAGAGEHGLAREKIAAFLWPEASLGSTRRSLDQLVYEVRSGLGEAAILGTNPVRLNGDVIESDIALFENALRNEALESAVALYRGPFLDGFTLSNAPGFDRWMESERARFAERFASILERLAAAAAARSDQASAIVWWRRLAAHDPLRVTSALGLMRALAASGDRASALSHARVYERLVMQELETSPDPVVTRFVEQLRHRAVISEELETEQEAQVSIARSPPVQTRPLPHPPVAHAVPRSQFPLFAAAGLAIAVAAAFVWSLWSRGSATGADVDRPTILITPFRVLGTDSSLQQFREGMVDLLASEFTGEGGPLAVDPRTAISAWTRLPKSIRQLTLEDAARMAHAVGAEWVLVGDLVTLPGGQVRLGGRLVRYPDKRLQIVRSVTVPRDGLAGGVSEFAGNVLTSFAGMAEPQPVTEITRSLPALRAYLAGRAEHRDGRDALAVTSFARALEFDSTFALAALDLVATAGWLLRWEIVSPFDTGRRIATLLPGSNPSRTAADDSRFDRALQIAWRERAKLSARDRALLLAIRGERHPDPSYARDVLAGMERATRISPIRAETHYAIGQLLLHQGPAIGLTDSRIRARVAFRAALALDSSYAAPMAGLLELAAFDADSAALRTLGALYLARDSMSAAADYVRWRVAVGTGDAQALSALRARFGSLPIETLERIQVTSQIAGIALDDADRATEAIIQRAGDSFQRWIALFNANLLALNRGRPSEAYRFLQLKRELERDDAALWHNACLDESFGDGERDAATKAIRGLRRLAAQRRDQPAWNLTLCLLMHGDTTGAGGTINRLRQNGDDRGDILDAIRAGLAFRSDASQRARLDSLALRGCCAGPKWIGLAAAAVHERSGDDAGALRSLRAGRWLFPPQYLSTYLREEGRLAARVGDRPGAIRAYRHYLALRSHPEPALRADVDRIRSELARLERGDVPDQKQ